MTIHLSKGLESSILAQVNNGRFASVDDAMNEAARLLLRELGKGEPRPAAASPRDPALGSIGAMRDAADELDEAVAAAMEWRKQPWRTGLGE